MFTAKPMHRQSTIYIGDTKQGNQMTLSIEDPLRVGILASSGSGKTVMLSNIVIMLAQTMRDRIQFVGFDPKLVSLSCLEPRLSVPVFTQPSEWLAILTKLEQILNDRLAEMRRRGWVKIDPFKNGDEFPEIIVIVEELPNFVQHPDLSKAEQSLISKWFDTFLTRCRAANMGVILCSHTFNVSDSISSLARAQLQTRLIGRCGRIEAHSYNEQESEKCDVGKLVEPGMFYVADKGNFSKWTLMKTWDTPPVQAETLCHQYSIDRRDIGLGWSVKNPFCD